jgi:hypothetical protein
MFFIEYLKYIVFKFYHVPILRECLAYNLIGLPNFSLYILIFSITFWTRFGPPHPSIVGISWCMCTHPIDPMGFHHLHYTHSNEHERTHDVICDIFAAIGQFHVGWKQLYALPLATSNSSRWQVDIVFTKDGVPTLTNIVIANPTQVDLLLWSCAFQRFAIFNATQTNFFFYRDQYPTNQFFLLIIEVFGCLHK